MKHLHKFNESTIPNTIIDIDYIEDCFVEFKDIGIFDLRFNYSKNNSDLCVIKIKTNKIKDSGGIQVLDDIYNRAKNKLEIIDEINYSLEKVKIKYPHIQYQVNEGKKYIVLGLSLDTSEHVIKFPSLWNI